MEPMEKLTLSSLPDGALRGRRVVVRVDYNVPLAEGRVGDARRIERTAPTLRHLAERGCRIVLTSHLGRPGGEPDPSLSLRPVAERAAEVLGRPMEFVPELVGPRVDEGVDRLGAGEMLLLENSRFHPGETENDPELAAALARLGDLFVNDAFGTAHRAHATTVGVARAVRERGGLAAAGFLMERELRFLAGILREPARPYVAILGGAKIGGKIELVERLLAEADRLLVGGAMANTFFGALGLETGRSLVEEDRIGLAGEVLERAGEKLVLPVDVTVADAIEEGARPRDAPRDEVGERDRIGDIGPRSREIFAAEIGHARTVLWNGPMGVFEVPPFAAGTRAVAKAVAAVADGGGTTVTGGGDTAAAVEAAGVAERMTHVSTGGGAALELLGGAELPGVAALSDADELGGGRT